MSGNIEERPVRSQNGPQSRARGRKAARRIAPGLDMTPLVDVAFLLLTFFMFSTVMAQPQAMEIRMPPALLRPVLDQALRKPVLTIYLRKDGRLFQGGESGVSPVGLPMKELKDFAVRRNLEGRNRLGIMLKVHPGARYQDLIHVLEELNLAEGELEQLYQGEGIRRERSFEIVSMTHYDQLEVETL